MIISLHNKKKREREREKSEKSDGGQPCEDTELLGANTMTTEAEIAVRQL